jgi:hypothetical protein
MLEDFSYEVVFVWFVLHVTGLTDNRVVTQPGMVQARSRVIRMAVL